jgi:hypothetical protein
MPITELNMLRGLGDPFSDSALEILVFISWVEPLFPFKPIFSETMRTGTEITENRLMLFPLNREIVLAVYPSLEI